MVKTIYEAVMLLVEELSDDEQHTLMETLAEKQKHKLSSKDWMTRLEAVMVAVKPGPLYSDSREDWYGDAR